MLEGVSGYFSPLWKQYRWYILTSKRSLNLTGPVRGKTLIRRIKLNEVRYQSSSLTPDMPFLGWSGWQWGHDWHGPLSCSQLNSHVHIQRWYWPLTPGPDAITIFESHRASGLVHNTININVLWLRRLWKNFLPHQYWWCCHTLESGPSLRIYKRNGGCGGGGGGVVGVWVSVCERGQCHFWSAPRWCTFSCGSEQFPWERGGCSPRLMRSEWRGVAQGQIQFPPQCFAGDDSYGKMNVSFQGIWEC